MARTLVPPRLHGRDHQDYREQRQQDVARHQPEELPTDEAAHDGPGRQDEREHAIASENSEAAAAAVSSEAVSIVGRLTASERQPASFDVGSEQQQQSWDQQLATTNP
jgi:hypothetical protein